MGETANILALWQKARAQGEQVCMATVVHVEGSSYRKPGARMLVTAGGERAGTISGGCLEAEVSRKIWWLTSTGARLEQYQSSFDEDGTGVPWGLGCGGTVWVLLERGPEAVLRAMELGLRTSAAAVIVSRLRGVDGAAGTLAVLSEETAGSSEPLPAALRVSAEAALSAKKSLRLDERYRETDDLPAFFLEYLPPPPRLTIFGAGDDAQPIEQFADALGWRVTVADGRLHMLRRERFPRAAELRLLTYTGDSPLSCAPGLLSASRDDSPGSFQHQALLPGTDPGVHPGDLAVVLTHSFEQDRALLLALLPAPLGYLGILGPRHRTLRLLDEVAPALGWGVEQCMERLRAPVGIDLGARDPASIALSIVAEMQATLAGRQIAVSRYTEAPKPLVHG